MCLFACSDQSASDAAESNPQLGEEQRKPTGEEGRAGPSDGRKERKGKGLRGSLKGTMELQAAMSELREEEPLIQVGQARRSRLQSEFHDAAYPHRVPALRRRATCTSVRSVLLVAPGSSGSSA